MWFVDWLKDIATFNSITYVEDSYGKESKVATPLYSDIKCRLWKLTPKLMVWKDRLEKMVNTYKIYLELEYNGAKRSDQVIINWQEFVIYWSQPATWWNAEHYIYNIKEDE